MQKILPVEYPPITSYPMIATLFSILWPHKDQVFPWIYDHFIQLVAIRNNALKRAIMNTFYEAVPVQRAHTATTCPYIKMETLDRRTLFLQRVDFTKYVEHTLEHQQYMIPCLNHFHLNCHKGYQKTQHMHTVFIYGYDRSKEIIYIADFFDEGKYVEKTITYNELNKSYFEHCIAEDDPVWMNDILIYKYEPYDYAFNHELLRQSVNDYINGCDSFNKYKYDFLYRNSSCNYGIDVYDVLIESVWFDKIDPRAFYVLYDHKKLMTMRIEYLHITGLLNKNIFTEMIKESQKIEQETQILLNLVLKNRIKRRPDIALTIIESCKRIREKDYEFMVKLLSVLE